MDLEAAAVRLIMSAVLERLVRVIRVATAVIPQAGVERTTLLEAVAAHRRRVRTALTTHTVATAETVLLVLSPGRLLCTAAGAAEVLPALKERALPVPVVPVAAAMEETLMICWSRKMEPMVLEAAAAAQAELTTKPAMAAPASLSSATRWCVSNG